MLDTFEQHALRYSTAYYLHVTENKPRPHTPPLHPDLAKALREIVLDVTAMQRYSRKRGA
jgi:hypothetical protein